MINKKTIMIFVVLFSVALVGARLGNFERNTCVDIKTILNTTSVTLSTLNFPNTTLIVSNQTMERNGQTFNYTFCNTSALGIYGYDYVDVSGNVFVNDFAITPLAESITTATSILYIIILIIISGLFFFFFAVAYYTPYENVGLLSRDGKIVTEVTKSKYIKLVTIWIAYGLFMWIIVILTGLINNYIKFEALKTLATNLYLFLNTIGYGVNAAIVWLLFYNLWKDIILNKTIIREGQALLKKA